MNDYKHTLGGKILRDSQVGELHVFTREGRPGEEGLVHETVLEGAIVQYGRQERKWVGEADREVMVQKGHDEVCDRVRGKEALFRVEIRSGQLEEARVAVTRADEEARRAERRRDQARLLKLRAEWALERAEDAAGLDRVCANHEPLNKLGIRPATIEKSNLPDEWLVLAEQGQADVWRSSGPPLEDVRDVVVVPSCREAYAYYQAHSESDFHRTLFVVCPVQPAGGDRLREIGREHLAWMFEEVGQAVRGSPAFQAAQRAGEQPFVAVSYASEAFEVGSDVPAEPRFGPGLRLAMDYPPVVGVGLHAPTWAGIVEKREAAYIRSVGGGRAQGVER